jgi:7-carboxy-7-deazaguanine synthase
MPWLFNALKRTRTSTGCYSHQHLKLARLPIPPPARWGFGFYHGKHPLATVESSKMETKNLNINEIFLSIQGESTMAGLPCVFIRLRGCPLRCRYCDTSYAFSEGTGITIDEIITQVQQYQCMLVEVTGGEPLLQPNVHDLMVRLCDLDYSVLVETSGQQPIGVCDPRVRRIVDIKTPNSGAGGSFLQANYEQLCEKDEVKFVITDREDFDWALHVVEANTLLEIACAVHFSPVMQQDGNGCIEGCPALSPEVLAEWILESGKNIRLHMQLHRYVWAPDTRGV